MELGIKQWDIVQVPRVALFLEEEGPTYYGVVISDRYLAEQAGQYLVIMVVFEGENAAVEIEITEFDNNILPGGALVSTNLIFNVTEDQFARIPKQELKRGSLGRRDRQRLQNRLREVLGVRNWR